MWGIQACRLKQYIHDEPKMHINYILVHVLCILLLYTFIYSVMSYILPVTICVLLAGGKKLRQGRHPHLKSFGLEMASSFCFLFHCPESSPSRPPTRRGGSGGRVATPRRERKRSCQQPGSHSLPLSASDRVPCHSVPHAHWLGLFLC